MKSARKKRATRSNRGRRSPSTHQSKKMTSGWLGLLLGLPVLLGILAWTITRVAAGQFATQPAQSVILAATDFEASYPVYLLVAKPTDPELVVIEIDPDLELDLMGEYGRYPARSVVPLLALDGQSAQYLRGSWAFGLEAVIDHVWTAPELIQLESITSVGQLFSNLTWGRMSVDTSRWQAFQWWAWSQNLRPDQLVFTRISSLDDWHSLQDDLDLGYQVHGCPIAIVNTTQVAGAGTKTSQVLESSGLSVIRVADTNQELAQTQLLVSADPAAPVACDPAADHIFQTLPLQVQRNDQPDGAELDQHRADVVLLIGQDLAEIIR